jgi:hypothetical protein
MTTLYKLTDHRWETRGRTVWGPGISNSAKNAYVRSTNRTPHLCTGDVIHAYEHPLLAALLNTIHAAFSKPVLWRAEGEVVAREFSLKVGCFTLTTKKIIPLPEISPAARIRLLLTLILRFNRELERDDEWGPWARRWLDGSDRTSVSASDVRYGFSYPAETAAEAAVKFASSHSPEEIASNVAQALEELLYDHRKVDLVAAIKRAIREEDDLAEARKAA